ncbi:MAG: MarR family transcriptional regulator, partial [Ignavibacteriae bacterium]
MTQEILLRQLRRRGIATAAELARSCGVSQPTVSRAIREAG